MSELTRRRLIQSGLVAAASVSFGPAFWRDAFAAPPTVVGPGPYGPLLPADANGLMLPPGFKSRVLARGGQVMPGRGYVFPAAPDGQATFAMPDGGWVLATNSEIAPPGAAACPRPASMPPGRSSTPTGSSAERTTTAPAARRPGARGCRARR